MCINDHGHECSLVLSRDLVFQLLRDKASSMVIDKIMIDFQSRMRDMTILSFQLSVKSMASIPFIPG